MERESSAVRAALASTDPRAALQDAVRGLFDAEFPRPFVVTVLDELADEFRARGDDVSVAAIVEVLDILEGQASSYAIQSFFGK